MCKSTRSDSMQQKYIVLCFLVAFVSIAYANEYRLKKSSSQKAEDDKAEDEVESRSLYSQEVQVDDIRNEAIKMISAPDLSGGEPLSSEDGSGASEEDDSIPADLAAALQSKILKNLFLQMNGVPYNEVNEAEEEITQEEVAKAMKELPELPELPPKVLTPEEQEAELLWTKAKVTLNATHPNVAEAYSQIKQAAGLGHIEARLHLAWAELLGSNPIRQDIDSAKATFYDLAENQNVAEAHMGLGFLYATGISVNASQARALVHYTVAALGGSQWARMALGYRYFAGATVPNSCEKSLDFYRKVANKVAEDVSLSGGGMVQRVRLLEEAENPGYNSGILDKDLIDYYQLLAEKGDVQAQVGLGQLHYQGGRGVQQDHLQAARYFLQAADAGNPAAMAFLGKIYLEGSDMIKQDNQTAFKYFKKAADQGNPVGQSGLGLMYLHGRGVPKDYQKALKYFTQAADQNWVDGQLQLGNMYFSGLGVRRNYRMANKLFALASQSGHVLAYYNLAQMHATGTGMLRSCSMAVELYKNVAERGKWGNRLMEAHSHYRNGHFEEAFVTYALLAELGYEVAQSNAAFVLDKGESLTLFSTPEEMYVRALMYWGRAAAQGYSAAQVKLGDYHYYGLGTPVDFEAAASHYRHASDHQHNAQAMFNLGYMHEQGLGMKQDIHLAKRCYDRASDTNHDAKVPVYLALMKLSLIFGVKYLQEIRWQEWFLLLNLNHLLGPYWDLYLITALLGLLIILVRYRRQ
ncbi:protein sel-1 homolog 1 [Thrips palmi]|uniref:Protein sel-1 homolog 1 n=1 Tax=Thrips palmi TaxID=161013 RepID=A0A6P9A1Q2_THRPL|nr:protein sel-1 homolog 1 [Thrips palmi]